MTNRDEFDPNVEGYLIVLLIIWFTIDMGIGEKCKDRVGGSNS